MNEFLGSSSNPKWKKNAILYSHYAQNPKNLKLTESYFSLCCKHMSINQGPTLKEKDFLSKKSGSGGS